jgi:hypothetical protein
MLHKTNYCSFDDPISVFWISWVHAFVLSCVELCVVLAYFSKLCIFSFYAFFVLFCDCDSLLMWLVTLNSIIWSWCQYQLSKYNPSHIHKSFHGTNWHSIGIHHGVYNNGITMTSQHDQRTYLMLLTSHYASWMELLSPHRKKLN